MIDKVIAHIDEQKNADLEKLFDLLRIECISTEPEKKPEIRKGAEWVNRFFLDAGFESKIVETKGHPCVIADTGAVSGAPVLLVYGHYDVQPTGEESLWKSPAFEPTVRDGKIHARGSADDKGQVMTHMLAAAAWKKAAGSLPLQIKFVVEGEEEISSPNIEAVLEKHKKELACDYVVLSDTPKFDRETPAITYGTKGMVYKEIIVSGPKQNLHSGSFGGTVLNPGNVLASLISQMHDAHHRITVRGFYDDVDPSGDEEKKAIAELPFDEAGYRENLGVPALDGEAGFSTVERRWVRPTLDVNGLLGGFTGEGASTVIPAKVMAKVSMRIVPNQDPQKISDLFDDFVQSRAPRGVNVEVITHGLAHAYVAPLDSPAMQAAKDAMEAAYGKAPLFVREGGTLPILKMFKQILGAESIMMGYCMPDCNAHGPNEYFDVSDLHLGTQANARFYGALAEL